MTVQQLIEKLKTLNPDAEVIIEENHGEYYPVKEERFYEEKITANYHHASEEELSNGIDAVVIRA